MKVTLLQTCTVHSLSLPEKINGQYFLMHTNAEGKTEPLLNIKANGEQWVIECGISSSIIGVNKNLKTYPISLEHAGIQLIIHQTDERAILLFEDDKSDMSVFKKFYISGTVKIGSDNSNDIVLKSSLVSPFSAVLTAGENAIGFSDVSTNRITYVNKKHVDSTTLLPGDILTIRGFTIIVGSNFIAMNKIPDVEIKNAAAVSEFIKFEHIYRPPQIFFDDISAENVFSCPPRFIERVVPYNIKLISPPAEHSGNKMPVALTLGPSFTMGIASASTATFTVINNMNQGADLMKIMPTLIMAGSMLAGSLVWPVISKSYEKSKSKHTSRNVKKAYIAYLENFRKELDEAEKQQRAVLYKNNPSAEELAERITYCKPQLWERNSAHDDFLSFRTGLGSVPVSGEIVFPETSLEIQKDVLGDELKKLRKLDYTLRDVPVSLSLIKHSKVGISGEKQRLFTYVKNMILQLTALHSYTEFKLVVICDAEDNGEWEYCKWLPHIWNERRSFRFFANNPDDMKQLSAALEKEMGEAKQNETTMNGHYIIVCTSPTLAGKSDLISHVLHQNEYSGFSAVLAYEKLTLLPKECSAVIELGEKPDADGNDAVLKRKGEEADEESPLKCEASGAVDFGGAAVTMANIKLATEECGFKLPNMLAFLEMFRVKKIPQLNCLQRWQDNNPVKSLAAPLGVDTRGDLFSLNLHQNAHGPHGLIAGMTGSGKSEFIMTMILSLAVNYSPKEVSFLLIDYKGGGMSDAFARLPHVAGVITNLDGAAINRSLVSIESELQRRQTVLKEAGADVNDIYKYQKLYREGRVNLPMQHLFIISDEFAELKAQQPEFMDKLISTARIGRSLGVHLILATQKPSGVVNDQIWSNSKFKICLKVQERADSMEVIKCPDAAALVNTGRFYIQVGFNEVFELAQSAWCGAPYTPDVDVSQNIEDDVTIIDNVGNVLAQSENEIRRSYMKKMSAGAVGQKEKKQLAEITDYLAELAEEYDVYSDKLWLEPVPPFVYHDELLAEYMQSGKPKSGIFAVIGKYDFPQKQSQSVLTLSPQAGNILLYGSAGMGKTTFLMCFIYSLISRYSPEKINFYIFDFGGETLAAFRNAPHVGEVMLLSDEDKTAGFFSYIHKEMKRRKKILSDYGGDFVAYSQTHSDMPLICVIIHNFTAFLENYEDNEQDITILSREGIKCGINIILTSLTSNGVKYRISQNFSTCVSLRLNDASYNAILPSARGMSPSQYKGRGLTVVGSLCEFQTAYICPEKDDEAYADKATEDRADFIRRRCSELSEQYKATRARPIFVLPKKYTFGYIASKQLELKNGAYPIALEKQSALPTYLSFGQQITPVIYRSVTDASETALAVAALLSQDGTADTLIIDVTNALTAEKLAYATEKLACATGRQPSDNGTVSTANTTDEAISAIHSFHAELMRRHLAAHEASQNGLPAPENRRRYLIIFGLKQLLDVIIGTNSETPEKNAYNKFGHCLIGSVYDLGYSIILFENSFDMANLKSAEWFSKNIQLNRFIWIGNGISDEHNFKCSVRDSDNMKNMPDDMGFIVTRGKAKAVKFIVNGDDDEDDEDFD